MKFKSLIFLVIAVLMVSACSSEEVVLQSSNTSKSATVKVKAEQKFPMDPYTVIIVVEQGENVSPEARTEIHLESATRDNILFDWESDNACIISFKETDGSVRQFRVLFNETNMSLTEIL